MKEYTESRQLAQVPFEVPTTDLSDILFGEINPYASQCVPLDKVNCDLIGAGASLHWLHVKAKNPVDARWSELPNRSESDLRGSYCEGQNIGIRLGRPSQIDGDFLHLVDLDIRDASKAGEAWAALLAIWPTAKLFPSVVSGSGGESRHLYILNGSPLKGRKISHSEGFSMVFDHRLNRDVKKWDWEIELFGTGKQAVLPPSIHPVSGQPYYWERNLEFGLGMWIDPHSLASFEAESVAEATDSDDDLLFLEDVQAAKPHDLTAAQVTEILNDLPDDWVEDREHWLTAGAAVHHQFQGKPEGFEIWCAWSKASVKFNHADARRVWKSFKGSKNPKTMRTLIQASQWPSNPILALNKDHAAIMIGAKFRILRENNGNFEIFPPEELHKLNANNRVPVSGEKRTEAITSAWMRHPKRRTFTGGLVFNPKSTPADAYNIWRGWAVQSDRTASCQLFLDHLRDVVCGGGEREYQWLLGWMAHLIQHPEQKPGTAVVLRGAKGAGKDTVGNYLGALFPRHHVTISQPEHLTGRFNAHLETALLLHLEEGYWAGDKQAEGVLKNLITCPTLQIERKGIDPYEIDHFARLLITSNADWVVPATRGERRYFVLDVSSARAKDSAYFGAIARERDNGGKGALLHFLQGYDLSGFDVRNPPETTGLTQQKLAGLLNVDAWWYDRLSNADLPQSGDGFGKEPKWRDAPISISREYLKTDYEGWLARKKWHGDALSVAAFGRRLRAMCNGLRDERQRTSGGRPRHYILPPLPEARSAFAAYIGGTLEWDD